MDIEVTLKLSEVTAAALRQLAETEDISIGQIIRDAIRRDLSRREQAKTPIRADERLVAPLRALLADDFAYAENWADLSRRLLQKGYRLAESGGGLILINHHNGQRLCKASELGHSYAQLTRKFDAAYPDHAHKMLPHSPRRFPNPLYTR